MTMGFGSMEATEDLDKNSFRTEEGTKATLECMTEGLAGKEVENEYRVEKVKILSVKQTDKQKQNTQTR